MKKTMLVMCLTFLASSAWAGSNLEDPSAPGNFTQYGDMLVYSNPEGFESLLKGAGKAEVELWEDGVLPLDFDESITSVQRTDLLSACAEWGKFGKVRCQVGPYLGRVLTVSNYEKGGCFALWGMGTSFWVLRRRMNLAPGCWRHSTLLHELGHAFGLIHEHQRPDRDRYVTVIPENVESGFLGLQVDVNFDTQASQLETPYDFLSIMHYSRKAFSSNGGDTLVPKPEYRSFIDRMGHVDELSLHDREVIAKLYPLVPSN